MRSNNDSKKSIGVDHLACKGCVGDFEKIYTWRILASKKIMHATTAEKKSTHFQWAEKRHVTRRKNIVHTRHEKKNPYCVKDFKNIVHQITCSPGPEKSNGPPLSDGEQIHSSPRWIFFSDNKSLIIHAQRVVKTKWNSLNPKQNLPKLWKN